MRVPFSGVFDIVDGRIIPQLNTAFDSVTIAAGVAVPPTLRISGTEIRELTNCDLSCEVEDELIVIVGFYPAENCPTRGC
jgi:hypothetical protein